MSALNPHDSNVHSPTIEEIEAARTPAGGWDRDQLAAWGVPWPPPKGWKQSLAGRSSLVEHLTTNSPDAQGKLDADEILQHPSMRDPRLCTHPGKTGTGCNAFKVKGETYCSGHLGLGIAADPSSYGKQGQAARQAQHADRAQQRAADKMSLREALRRRAAAERDALVDAFFAPLHDADAQPWQRQQAARTILERIMGRPGEELETGEEAQPRTLEELIAAFEMLGTEGQEPSTPAVPVEAQQA